MEERSNLEIIKDIARQKSCHVESEELSYPVSGIRTFPKYKRTVYMCDKTDPTAFFVWHSDAYAKQVEHLVFCGAFIPLPFHTESRLNIRKRNFLDKINPFVRSERLNNDQLNSKIITTGELCSDLRRLLSSPGIERAILKALDISLDIRITVNHYPLDFVPALQGKACIGIINPQMWILEKDKIDSYLKVIERMKANINNLYQFV